MATIPVCRPISNHKFCFIIRALVIVPLSARVDPIGSKRPARPHALYLRAIRFKARTHTRPPNRWQTSTHMRASVWERRHCTRSARKVLVDAYSTRNRKAPPSLAKEAQSIQVIWGTRRNRNALFKSGKNRAGSVATCLRLQYICDNAAKDPAKGCSIQGGDDVQETRHRRHIKIINLACCKPKTLSVFWIFQFRSMP